MKAYPTTVYTASGGKISDGQSVRVTVPENTDIEAGKFYLLDGFLGCAMQSATTATGETAEIVLNIEQAEYETDQVAELDVMEIGAPLYWDHVNKLLTVNANNGEAEPTAFRAAGRVTVTRDSNNVIWFVLGPQV